MGLGLPDPRHAVRCSACSASMPDGGTFCSDCGFVLARLDGLPTPGPCPSCDRKLDGWGLAPTQARPSGYPIAACRGCGGVWLPVATRTALVDDAATTAAARGDVVATEVVRRQLPTGALAQAIVYRRCPDCRQRMQRKNFGGCSGVLVDECRCGSYFDAGELEDVLAFVRSGGLQLSRRRADEERTRQLRNAESAAISAQASGHNPYAYEAETHASASFVGWVGRWIARAFS
ncbi:MAG: zf-TFIIB domain-containing protein [Deltaproteobacteria bacterium]|nr:zf-TFIIB domain-containing protein [Nannocystaceae bacterium]